MWAFINNQFVTAEQAVLPVSDLAIQRGYGVFDFFRTVDKVPLFIDHHLDRLQHSASVLRLQLPFSKDELKSIVHELINGCLQRGKYFLIATLYLRRQHSHIAI